MRIPFVLAILSAAIILQSCGTENPNRGKPIVLGDPATIVTETDSQYLQDFVADVRPLQPVAAPPAEPQQPAQDTAAKQPEKEAAPAEPEKKEPEQPKEEPRQELKGNGLKANFKEVSILIPNLTTRSYKQQDLSKASGASFEMTGGKLNGNQIKLSGGKVTRVSQRYQTVIVVKNELGTLVLDQLSRTTNWQALKGGNNSYTISGLDDKRLEYVKASPNSIKNAVTRAVKNKRMSRAMQQKWINSVRNVRAANQKPLTVELRSVMWKIDGKDASGKAFQKQLRLDIPL